MLTKSTTPSSSFNADLQAQYLDLPSRVKALLPRFILKVPMVSSEGPLGELRTLFYGIRQHRMGLGKDLETMIEKVFGVRRVLLVESGRAAIKLALMAFGLREGDGVILPAYVCESVLLPILELRLRPILADVRDDLQVDPASIDRVCRLGAKAVIVPHLFGGLADMDEILDVSRKHRLFVVDDAAQCAGLRWRSQCVGTLGDVGILSFGPFKPLGAVGGGAFLTQNDKLYESAMAFVRKPPFPRSPIVVWIRFAFKFGLRPFSYLLFLIYHWARRNQPSSFGASEKPLRLVYEMQCAQRSIARVKAGWAAKGWDAIRLKGERFRKAVEASGRLENVLPPPYVGFPRWPVQLSSKGERVANLQETLRWFLSRGVEVYGGYAPITRALRRAGIQPVGEYQHAEERARKIFLLPFHGGVHINAFF